MECARSSAIRANACNGHTHSVQAPHRSLRCHMLTPQTDMHFISMREVHKRVIIGERYVLTVSFQRTHFEYVVKMKSLSRGNVE